MSSALFKWFQFRIARQRLSDWRTIIRRDPDEVFKFLAILEYGQGSIPAINATGYAPAGLEQDADTLLRQKLFRLLRNLPFLQRRIMRHLARGTPVLLPLPTAWQQVLRGQGVTVSRFCGVYWLGMAVFLFLDGVFKTWTHLKQTHGQGQAEEGTIPQPYGVLMDMGLNQLPTVGSKDEARYDYLNWYRGWSGRNPEVREIWAHCQGAKKRGQVDDVWITPGLWPFPPLGREALTHYRKRLGRLLWQTFWGMVKGESWKGILFHEVAMAHYCTLLPPVAMAREYLFNNSSWIVRPLWSYHAERIGSTIYMLYYSANNFRFYANKPPSPPYGNGEGVSSWPRYILMLDELASMIAKLRQKEIVATIDPLISFVDSNAPLPEALSEESVAVFDVTPFKISFLAYLGVISPYYTGITMVKFINDIAQVLASEGRIMAMKRKRLVGDGHVHKGYLGAIERVMQRPEALMVNPEVSARRLIEQCGASIAFPLTSTTVIARALGRPTIYYDPLGIFKPFGTHVHGIRVISDLESLRQWVRDLPRNPIKNQPKEMIKDGDQSGH